MRGVIIKSCQLSPGSFHCAGCNHQILCVVPKSWFKGTEKLAPVICAHAEAEEGHREACSYLLCPRCDGIEAQEGVRRIGKSKDSDLCASAHRCPHYAYARLIARVTFNLVLKAMDGGRDASASVDESITGEGVHRHDGRVA